ncbi:MAG: hypothetical protein M3Q44_06645 [bacterium]|nr:hypothetical protein [bacterium]
MNQEEPTLPVNPAKKLTNINAAGVNADTPMDEFEYTGKGSKAGIKNMLKLAKIGGIILIVLIVVGSGALFIKNLLNSNNTNIVTATATPGSTILATAKPQITYPTEYDDVQKEVETYDQTVNSVSDTRSRLEVPSITFGVSF